MDMKEWHSIPNWPWYFVSRDGQVLSIKKFRGSERRILKLALDEDGYPMAHFRVGHVETSAKRCID